MAGVYPLNAMLLHRHQPPTVGPRCLLAIAVLIAGGWAIGRACLDTGYLRHEDAVDQLQSAVRADDSAAFDAACRDHASSLTSADYDDALRLSAIYGTESVLRRLLANGIDPNAADERGTTPLMLLAIGPDGQRLASDLIKAGADVNATDFHGRTALMKAVFVRQAGMVRYLLDHGASVQPIDESGESAMTEAARGGDAAIIQLLEQAMEKSRLARAKNAVGRRIG